MEAYLYFDVDPDHAVLHLLGEPNATKHMWVHNHQAIISPPWSIHSGSGTKNYSFIWGMAGENKDYTDMDFSQIKLFGNKKFSDLLKEIHVNQKDKEAQLRSLIEGLKPLITSPPKIKIANNTTNVVDDVFKVLPKVLLKDTFITLPKFQVECSFRYSLILSNTITVSFIEYPITVKIAAIKCWSISIWNGMNL